jgi:hypothetical protein
VWALGSAGPDGGCIYQYWPFSSSDLYNWKAQNPPFSEDPTGLTDLFESILHTHSPTWDDCQQLLKTLFTTEEREWILTEARKNVPSDNGRPTTLPNLIDDCFPLNRPDWDYGNAEGRECLRVYCQTLMAGTMGMQKVGSVSGSTARLLCHSGWQLTALPIWLR